MQYCNVIELCCERDTKPNTYCRYVEAQKADDLLIIYDEEEEEKKKTTPTYKMRKKIELPIR